MAAHFIVLPDGPHRMKEWLRENPTALPPGLDIAGKTSHQVRAALKSAGWVIRKTGSQVHLFPPGSTALVETEPAALDAEAPRGRGERGWVHSVIQPLQAALASHDPSLRVLEGRRLAYRREVLQYMGDVASEESGMRYETDILVAEGDDAGWIPRVVVEAKLRTVTTHDAITYSQKAANHKNVHPYLRYGIFLGARRDRPLPGRLYRHGAEFDFMLSWKGLEPAPAELNVLVDLLIAEVETSRLLQQLMFDSRRRDRPHFTLFHRAVAVGGRP